MSCHVMLCGVVWCQPRSQALSPFPPLSSREEKERGPGNEVGVVWCIRSVAWRDVVEDASCKMQNAKYAAANNVADLSGEMWVTIIIIGGSIKNDHKFGFELQSSRVIEKRCNVRIIQSNIVAHWRYGQCTAVSEGSEYQGFSRDI